MITVCYIIGVISFINTLTKSSILCRRNFRKYIFVKKYLIVLIEISLKSILGDTTIQHSPQGWLGTKLFNILGMILPQFLLHSIKMISRYSPDSKVHGVNMGHTWVLSAPDGPNVGPMNLALGVPLLRRINFNPILSYDTLPGNTCGIQYTPVLAILGIFLQTKINTGYGMNR